MSRVAAAALASRLTNVVTIDASPAAYYTWKELGVTVDGHSIGHMTGHPDRDKHCTPIRKFHAERVADLARRIPDFVRAYEPDGMTVEEFDTYGATARTLRGFVKAYHDLVATVNDIVIPNPDVKR